MPLSRTRMHRHAATPTHTHVSHPTPAPPPPPPPPPPQMLRELDVSHAAVAPDALLLCGPACRLRWAQGWVAGHLQDALRWARGTHTVTFI